MTESTTPTIPSSESEHSGSQEATPSSSTEKGFPEGTAVADMTPEQQIEYWKHHAQKHEKLWEKAAKATHGLTPQEIADLQAKVESLETEKLSATDKALKQARDEAAKAASEAAKAEFLPQIQALQVKSIASQVISGDKLNAFMAIADPSKFVGSDGSIDESAVMGHLTAMYGDSPSPNAGPRWQNFGQFTPPPPAQKPGSGGAAEAAKRFGTKTS